MRLRDGGGGGCGGDCGAGGALGETCRPCPGRRLCCSGWILNSFYGFASVAAGEEVAAGVLPLSLSHFSLSPLFSWLSHFLSRCLVT